MTDSLSEFGPMKYNRANWEQDYLVEKLKRLGEIATSRRSHIGKHCITLLNNVFNSYYKMKNEGDKSVMQNSIWQRGDFVCHTCGYAYETKINILKSVLAWMKNTTLLNKLP